MAETSKKSTQSLAKGTTADGKPATTTARRTRARAKSPGRKKAPPAEATAQKPQPAAEDNHSGAAGIPRAAGPESHGLDRLTEGAEQIVVEHWKPLLDALLKQAEKGNVSGTRLLIGLLNQKKRNSAMNSDEPLQSLLNELLRQPEDLQPAEEGDAEPLQPGVLETVHAVAESPSKP